MIVPLGKYRHRVVIQTPVLTTNAIGERIATWVNRPAVYAAIEPVSARELPINQAIEHEVTHSISFRFPIEVGSESRIKLGQRTFSISSVINVDERNIELRVLCHESEGVA